MHKILGIIWSTIAIILLVVLICGLKGKRFNMFRFGKSITIETGKLYSTDIFDADKIDSLDIDLLSEALVLKGHNEDVVKVELYCNEETAPKIDVRGSTLSIESVKRQFNVSMMNRKVVVYVPFNKKFQKADIDLVSGSIHIDDFNCDTLESKSVSGSCNIENSKFNILDTEQTSGSLHINNSSADTLDADCTSGSVHIDGDFSGIDIKSSSGSVHVTLKNPLKIDSSVVSTSGSIHLTVPKKSDLSIEYKSNGIYKNSITGTGGKSGNDRMGSGDVNLFVKATSGSIHID